MNGENYEKCLAELQEYARKNLTTEALGKYFLEKVGLVAASDNAQRRRSVASDNAQRRISVASDNAQRRRSVASDNAQRRILFVSQPSLIGANIDYQRDCLAIGLLSTGVSIDFYEDLPWLFDDYTGDCSSLYGIGYSICKKVPASKHRLPTAALHANVYDLIIVATSSSHFKLDSEITKWLEKQSSVPKALVMGNDGSFTDETVLQLARENYSFPFRFIFVRELN
jgi:hypothetical protein